MSAFSGVDTIELLQAGMRTAQMNHRLIANNIANALTPNYNPVHMDFQETLRAVLEGRDRFSLRRTDPRHLDSTRNLVDFERLADRSKNDYNKVDVDAEIIRLSENTGRYTLYSSLLRQKVGQYRSMLTNMR